MKPPIVGARELLDANRCPKLAWLRVKEGETFPASDTLLFDQGPDLEALALTLFPGGAEKEPLALAEPFAENFFSTGESLPFRTHAWYRPRLTYKNFEARGLCLVPGEGEEGFVLDLYEVTVSRDLRDKDMDSLAFQAWVFRSAGFPIGKVTLLCLERDYIHEIPVSAKKVFRPRDLTERSKRLHPRITEKLEILPKLYEETEEPFAETGSRCFYPTACPLLSRCHPKQPEWSVYQLSKGKKTAQELIAAGYQTLHEVPLTWPLTQAQRIQVHTVKTGEVFKNPPAIQMFLDSLEFPVYFLDFETYQTALPLHRGTTPYQMIPFQFSLHILDSPDAEPRHTEYLSPENADPREDILRLLRKDIGPTGSIAAFNAGFETARLREMGEAFRDFQEWCRSLSPRFVDFWDPFRFFHYYHAEQRGKTGIKTLLPILSGRSYEELELADGHAASILYMETHLRETEKFVREATREKLLSYCKMDTWAMVEIYRSLRKIALEKSPSTFF